MEGEITCTMKPVLIGSERNWELVLLVIPNSKCTIIVRLLLEGLTRIIENTRYQRNNMPWGWEVWEANWKILIWQRNGVGNKSSMLGLRKGFYLDKLWFFSLIPCKIYCSRAAFEMWGLYIWAIGISISILNKEDWREN